MEKLTDLANKSDEFKHGYCNGRIDEEYLWKCKIKAYIPKSKVKEVIEQLDYNDIGNFERRCKQEVLQELLGKE